MQKAIGVLVTGKDGQLGRALQDLALKPNAFEFKFFGKSEFDLSDEHLIKEVLQKEQYDFIINAGAYTAVDKAEEEAEMCHKINATALAHMAKYAHSASTIVHISSDYVYHHNPGRPLEESDTTNAQSVYAKSKLAGETLLLEHKPKSIVIRSSWIYAREGHNFVNTMLRLGASREELSVVSDQIGTPTYAPDLAEAILQMISTISGDQQNHLYGVYNYSNEGICSWAEFAEEIFKIKDIACKVNHIDTEQYPTPAMRPKWSVMSKKKIKDDFSLDIPHWKESLHACLQQN